MAGCQILDWLLVYMGVPLGGNPRAATFWDLVVKKIYKHLDNWKESFFFSLGGHITLFQACLSNIHLCYLSLFRISVEFPKQHKRS